MKTLSVIVLLMISFFEINFSQIIKIPLREYSNLMLVMSKHFQSDFSTLVYTSANYTYINELIVLVQHEMNGIQIGVSFDLIDGKYNVLLIGYSADGEYQYNPEDNVLIYLDLRDYSGNFICQNYFRANFTYSRKWISFRTLILCDLLNGYQLWIKEPWSKYLVKSIRNVKFAYFNKKVNLHGTPLSIISELDVYTTDFTGKMTAFSEYFKQNWNITPVKHSNTILQIYSEPLSMRQHKTWPDAYTSSSQCIIVHKNKFIPSWQALIRCFHWKLWVFIVVVWIISSIVWRQIHSTQSFYSCLSDMMSLFLTNPINWMQSIRKFESRIISGTIMLISIILISGGLQSKLYANLQSPGRYPPINTMEDLSDSNITIHCQFSMFCYFFFKQKNFTDPSILEIRKKVRIPLIEKPGDIPQIFKGQTTIHDVYSLPQIGLIYTCSNAEKLITEIPKYNRELHIMNIRLMSIPLFLNPGFGINNRPLPFNEEVKRIIALFYQNGIAQYLDDLQEWITLMKILFHEKQFDDLKVFSLEDLQIAFLLLLIGVSCATLVFILEVISAVHYRDSLDYTNYLHSRRKRQRKTWWKL